MSAAAAAGIAIFDTARAYGHGDGELGHNERLRRPRAPSQRRRGRRTDRDEGRHAAGLQRLGARREGEGDPRRLRGEPRLRSTASRSTYLPDARARSADAMGGHQSEPWRASSTSGLVRRVGLSNVNRLRLDKDIERTPIAAVEISLSLLDDQAIRGGVAERCREAGIALMAHSPLGGPRRAAGLARRPGARRDRTAARRASGGGRAGLVAPRSHARRHRDPEVPTSGDRAVGRPCRDARG